MKLNSMLLAGLAATAITTGVAQAQPAPAAAPPAPGRQWQRPDPAQMAERRAERLRTILQLRADQEPALKAYLEASARPKDGGRKGDRGQMAAMTTPQRLDQMQTRMAERQAKFQQHAAATKRFYAALSPAQQKAFDAMGPMGGRHGGHRGGPGGKGGDGKGWGGPGRG